ncbi:ATP-binding protein, partial [Enterococcus faecium]
NIFNQINRTEREFLLSVLSKLFLDFSLPTSFDKEPVFITVEDNGIGMIEEEQKNIWDRYYKADPSSKNTKIGESGLGLSIVKELVRLHHGSIEVTSRKNEGTTFLIQFPKEK